MKELNCLIITGGSLNQEFAKDFISRNNFSQIIAVDKGLKYCSDLNLMPNHVLGDFDSIDEKILNEYKSINNSSINFHTFNSQKDYTDTHLAVELAMDLDSTAIVLLGAIGTRLDHSISNIQLLTYMLKKNISGYIINENNKIYLIDKSKILKKENVYGNYLSLMPLTKTVSGITLKGFKYPLNNHTIALGETIGISNEIIEDEALIDLDLGILIVIESND